MPRLRRPCASASASVAPASAPVRVTVTEPGPRRLRLTLDGELDASAGPLLADVAAAVAAAGPAEVELDARGVDFVDLRGLRALGRLRDQVERWGATTVVRTSRALDRLVAVCVEVGALAAVGAAGLGGGGVVTGVRFVRPVAAAGPGPGGVGPGPG